MSKPKQVRERRNAETQTKAFVGASSWGCVCVCVMWQCKRENGELRGVPSVGHETRAKHQRSTERLSESEEENIYSWMQNWMRLREYMPREIFWNKSVCIRPLKRNNDTKENWIACGLQAAVCLAPQVSSVQIMHWDLFPWLIALNNTHVKEHVIDIHPS